MKWWDKLQSRPFFIKLLNWEYWPAKAFYYPLAPYIIWLMIRSRHMCFWSAANPSIYSAGMGMESKYDTILKIPERYRPKALLYRQGEPMEELSERIAAAGISFPLIAKPDRGFRGLLVKKVGDVAALKEYLQRFPIDFIIQEFIALPEEVGVLYYRMPEQEQGRVTSLTTKEFLTVKGDGQSTVEELIYGKPRALLQLPRIREQHPEVLSQRPAQGERVPLGIVGNHAKGTRFINSNPLIDEGLCRTMDRISRQIDGFYYGRFDLKCESLQSLWTGEGIKVIEVNGVCSEPTHIYDPQGGTYFDALRDIARHWGLIRRISAANHRRGVAYMPHGPAARAILELFAYQRRVAEWATMEE